MSADIRTPTTVADALAGVAELVDAPDLGSGGESRGGSSPSARTTPTIALLLPGRAAAVPKNTMRETMNVTETLSEGLKREYRVVVPATDLAAKVEARLNELKDRVQIRGFRPGKVPLSHLQRLYGRSAMAETIEATVRDTNARIFSERGFKLASEAKVTLPTEEKEVEKLIGGQSDLDYTVAIEIVPEIKLADFKSYKLTRLTAEVADSEIDETAAAESSPAIDAEPSDPELAKEDAEQEARTEREYRKICETVYHPMDRDQRVHAAKDPRRDR